MEYVSRQRCRSDDLCNSEALQTEQYQKKTQGT